jgi:hypothetical protein
MTLSDSGDDDDDDDNTIKTAKITINYHVTTSYRLAVCSHSLYFESDACCHSLYQRTYIFVHYDEKKHVT